MALFFEDFFGVALKSLTPRRYKGDGSVYYDCPSCKGRGKLEVSANGAVWCCHKQGVGGIVSIKSRPEHTCDITESTLDQYTPCKAGQAQMIFLQKHRRLPLNLVDELRPHTGPSLFRVYLPLYEYGSQTPAYFVGRAMFDGLERYYNPRLGDFLKRKSQLLWGLHRPNFPVETLVLCEGVFDAVWLPNSAALLGSSISDAQVQLVPRLVTQEVIVLLDGDAHAKANVIARKISLQWAGKVSVARLPHGKDPDELHRVGNHRVVELALCKRERVA